MSTKFRNLTGIDSTEPDVYETPDFIPKDSLMGRSPGVGTTAYSKAARGEDGTTGENGLLEEDDDHHHNHNNSAASRTEDGDGDDDEDDPDAEIIRPHLSVSNASAKFIQATTEQDFSGRIYTLRRKPQQTSVVIRMMRRRGNNNKMAKNGGSSSKNERNKMLPDRDEYSMLPSVVVENETKLQRLRRLMFEVQELGEELEKAKAEEEEKEKQEKGGNAGEGGDEGDAAADQTASEDANTTMEDAAADPAAKTKKRKKNTLISPANLLKHVSSLQGELGRLNSIAQGLGDANLLGVSGTATGTLIKQSEVSKQLLSQLAAFKAMSINGGSTDGQTAAAETSSAPPPEAPNGDILPGKSPSDQQMVTYELFYSPETARLIELSKTNELESRIHNLEKLIGVHLLQNLDQDDDSIQTILQSAGTLVGALDRLDHHLALLTQPRLLDNLSRRLKTVVADMEKLMELRKKQQLEHFPYSRGMPVGMGDMSILPTPNGISEAGIGAATSAVSDIDMHAVQTESERKVNFLFATLQRLDPVVGVIPQLITRLHALRSLHTEAAVFSDSLKMISEEQVRARESYSEIQVALSQMEMNLKENSLTVEKNIQALDSRVSSLMEALAASTSHSQ